MATLYEILEVSENASSEVIDKAYKVLAKKYHPDLQNSGDRSAAEEKMKQLNEAYNVLSDDIKRKEYDQMLKSEREEAELKKEEDIKKSIYVNRDLNKTANTDANKDINKDVNNAINNENVEEKLNENYYNYLRSLGYTIKEGWTWQRVKSLFLTILVIIIIIAILWIIPPTHNMLIDLYENNIIIKILVDIVGETLSAIFKFIKGLFV